jgi:outer membrane protein TolC
MVAAAWRWVCGAWLVAAFAHGAAPLSFRSALERASERSPAARASERAARLLEEAASVSDPLLLLPGQLQLTGGSRFFPEGARPGFDATAQFQQPLPLRPIGRTRRSAMDAARVAAVARAAEARAAVLERAAHAWVETLFAERSLALRKRNLAEAQVISRIARARVVSGFGAASEQALAVADEALSETEVLDAEGRVTEARVALGALIAVEPEELTLDEAGAPLEVPPPDLEAAARVVRAKHPSLERARTYAQSLAREADFLHAQNGVALGVGFSASHEGNGEVVSSALVNVPLAWSSPARAETLRARAEAEEADLMRAFEEEEVLRQLRIAVHEHEHTRAVAASADRAVAALRDAYRIARALADRGATDLTLATLARQRLLNGEDRALAARASVVHANVRLLSLSNALLEGSPR